MRFFIYSIFLSAFLLFQIQPMIARIILPLFGGSSAVWSTCMLFFQAGLLIGYSYSHLIVKWLSLKNQVLTHLSLLCISLVAIPVFPSDTIISNLPGSPVLGIILILGVTVGFPYVMVSATGPLLQHWFSLANPKKSPYRLYALSNLGSLIGLLSYPTIIEPYLNLKTQTWCWSAGYILFILCCGIVAKNIWNIKPEVLKSVKEAVVPIKKFHKLFWLLLAFMGTTSLLSVTNKLTQDIVVVPFLWIVPLSLYLLSFIIAFEKPVLYNRKVIIPLILILIYLILYSELQSNIYFREIPFKVAIVKYNLFVFLLCLGFHGELARLKPHERFLTLYYLIISAGGILGGLFVNLLIPVIFKNYWELYFAIIAGILLLTIVILNEKKNSSSKYVTGSLIVGIVLIEAVCLYVFQLDYKACNDNIIAAERNFYGVLKVTEENSNTPDVQRTLSNGRVMHGIQFMDSVNAFVPLTYYTSESGIGLAIASNPARAATTTYQGLKVGLVGLGIGTVSAFAIKNDTFKYYELNPLVEKLARKYFKYLSNAQGKTIVVNGDGRKSLERELKINGSNQFDVLVIDAFTGDVIPTHLLTLEAVDLYFKHLKPDGILAFHISSTYLNLMPVMCGISVSKKLPLCYVQEQESQTNPVQSQWVLFTNNQTFLGNAHVQELSTNYDTSANPKVIWTDDYSSVMALIH